MVENTPRCRLCGYQLKNNKNGCTACTDIKRNLVWPVISDEESNVSALTVVSSTISLLRTRVRKLKTAIARDETKGYDASYTRDIIGLSKALKELAAEKRKLEKRESDDYAALGIEGRMELLLEQFFSRLPSDFQAKMLEAMQVLFIKQNQTLKPKELTTNETT